MLPSGFFYETEFKTGVYVLPLPDSLEIRFSDPKYTNQNVAHHNLHVPFFNKNTVKIPYDIAEKYFKIIGESDFYQKCLILEDSHNKA